MSNIKNRKEGGFTIIEVLIVLAIAGLIMLIVFLAVPALQRNSRNTQRKNDVSSLIGAAQEYVNNNGGKMPTDVANVTDNAKLGFYNNAGDVVLGTGTDKDKVYLQKGYKCNGNAATTSGASSRNLAAVFYIETSGDPQAQCQDM